MFREKTQRVTVAVQKFSVLHRVINSKCSIATAHTVFLSGEKLVWVQNLPVAVALFMVIVWFCLSWHKIHMLQIKTIRLYSQLFYLSVLLLKGSGSHPAISLPSQYPCDFKTSFSSRVVLLDSLKFPLHGRHFCLIPNKITKLQYPFVWNQTKMCLWHHC